MVAEGVLLCKGLIGGEADDPELRRLLVFRLDADVENLVRPDRRVGEHHRLSPATVQGLERERAGDHPGVQIGQGGISRDVEIDVRLQIPRQGQIAVGKGDERDVAPVGQSIQRVGKKEIGEHVEAPLIGLAVGQGRQLKIGAHPLVQQRRAVGDGNEGRGGNHVGLGAGQANERTGQFSVARSNDQRIVLHHVIGVGADRVHVHPPAHHTDRVIGAQRRAQDHVLHIVDEIEARCRVDVDRLVVIKSRGNAVAQEHLAAVQIGQDQVQVVHQFDARARIARRIGPHQGHAQGNQLAVGRQAQFPGVALAGAQGIGRALVEKPNRPALLVRVGQRRRQTVGQVDQPPTLDLDHVGHAQIVVG